MSLMSSSPLLHQCPACNCCIVICRYIYICIQNHNDTIIKTSEDFFKKIYLSLYLKSLCVRGSWRPNRTATYWPPLLWPSAWCLSRSPGLLNRRPWLSLPHLVTNKSPNYLLPVFTELYNSSIAHSISLEWHVWSSSSGKYYHAVHRSLSSGASVYDCTLEF